MCLSSVGTLHGGAPRTGRLASQAIRTVQMLLPQGNAFRGTARVFLEWVLFWRKSANWRLLGKVPRMTSSSRSIAGRRLLKVRPLIRLESCASASSAMDCFDDLS